MAFQFSPKIVTDGLVLYLDSGNIKSYPGSGLNWYDLSRSDNNASLVNGPTFDSSDSGSILFDGSNDLVSANSITGLTSFSISIWFKMTGPGTTGGTSNTIYNTLFGINSLNRRILVRTSVDTSIAEGRILVQMGGSNYFSDATTGITTTNAWNNVVYTFSSNTANLYINGVVQTPQSNSSVTFPDASIYLGAYTNPIVAYAMKGNISQTLVYNRALSLSEVLQNYNAIKSRFKL